MYTMPGLGDSTTTSGQYGFNGGVNILGTMAASAISLNGNDLDTILSGLKSSATSNDSSLRTALTTGTLVPLHSTNADNATLAANATEATHAVNADNSLKVNLIQSVLTDETIYRIPFATSNTGNSTMQTHSEFFWVPKTKTMTLRNIQCYGNLTATSYTGSIVIPGANASDLIVEGGSYIRMNPGADISYNGAKLTDTLNAKVDT